MDTPIGLERQSPLHLSLLEGWDEITRWLIENGTNVQQKDRKGRLPIHIAAQKGNVTMVRLLHACGSSLFMVDSEGKQVCHYAAESKSTELIDFLRSKEVPLNPEISEESRNSKKAPLHLLTERGNLQMLAQFHGFMADMDARDQEGNSQLYYATLSGNPKILDLFIETPLVKEQKGLLKAILVAIQLDSIPQLRLLQPCLTHIDQRLEAHRGMTMLHVACQIGAEHVFQYLLKEGADPLLTSYDHILPFDYAVLHDHTVIAHQLSCATTIDVNAKMPNGKSYLHVAAEKGSVSMVTLLMSLRANLNILDPNGSTALHLAVSRGERQVIKLLIGCGALSGIKNSFSKSPPQMTENPEIHQIIADYDHIINLCIHSGGNGIHAAVMLENKDVLLAMWKIENVYQLNNDGDSPMHLAVRLKRSLAFMRCLATLAPDIWVHDRKKRTPLQLAKALNNPKMQNWFYELSGFPSITDTTTNDQHHTKTSKKENVILDFLPDKTISPPKFSRKESLLEENDPISSELLELPSRSIPAVKETLGNFSKQLYGMPIQISKNNKEKENRFYTKYKPSCTSQHLVPSKCISVTTERVVLLNTYLEKDPGNCESLRQIERVLLLRCMQHYSNEETFQAAQKMVILWSKAFKKSLGDFAFQLLMTPQSYAPTPTTITATASTHIKVMQKMIEMSENRKQILPLLQGFNQKVLKINDLASKLDILKEGLDRERFPEKPISTLLEEFSSVRFPLPEEVLISINTQYQKLTVIGDNLRNLGLANWVATVQEIKSRYSKGMQQPDDMLTLLAIGREVIRSKFNINPYNTQIFAVLGLLTYPQNIKGCFAQVRTGEGKSTITTLLIFVFACQGRFIDVISSNRYLARRDAEKYAPLFADFNTEVSHICSDEPTKENFRAQIIYGTNYDFEFSKMRDCLNREQIRFSRRENKARIEERPYDVVLVDELDNLFIDEATSSARIAIPSLNSATWMYGPILTFVKSCYEKTPLLFEMIQLIPDYATKYIVSLREELSNFQNSSYKQEISEMSNRQLTNWFINAYKALYEFRENHNYVVMNQEVQTVTGKEQRKKIVIVDWNNTGKLKEKRRWQDGIHQFLEAKHQLTIEPESSTVAAISHPLYFNGYKNIYGLTGTGGSKVERQEIEEIYGITSFDVPLHKNNQRITLPPILAATKEEHESLILQEAQKFNDAGMPCLVLCETTQETMELAKISSEKGIGHQVLNERQPENEDFIIARAGEPSRLTLATNNAGRGTDIILHPDSKSHGGLGLLMTSYPKKSERVEIQGFGRTARQGQPGTARLIIQTTKTMQQLNEERDAAVIQESKYRKAQIKKEMEYHIFLEAFWENLQSFYRKSLNLFNIQNVKCCLREMQSDPLVFQESLEPLAASIQAAEDPHTKPAEGQFEKEIQERLGLLAQQYWAYYFFNKLHQLDKKINVEQLYDSTHHLWENILEIG